MKQMLISSLFNYILNCKKNAVFASGYCIKIFFVYNNNYPTSKFYCLTHSWGTPAITC